MFQGHGVNEKISLIPFHFVSSLIIGTLSRAAKPLALAVYGTPFAHFLVYMAAMPVQLSSQAAKLELRPPGMKV